MAQRDLEIILKAKDEASKEIEKASKATDSWSGSLKKLAIGAGALYAGKQIVDFGKDSFMAFADAEAKMASFDATLKTLGNDGLKMRQQLISASDTVLKFGFDNEESANMMARFAQVTGDANEAIKLNQIAMDLARAKNVEYETASKAVLSVMAGNTRVLKEFGIAVGEGATPLQALGQLQEQVAGQAEAFTQTAGGSMAVLTGAWSELKEVVGATLAESIVPFIQTLTTFVTDPKFIEFVKALTKVIGVSLTGAIWAVKEAINGWIIIFTALFDLAFAIGAWFKDAFVATLNTVATSIQWVIDKVEALISALKRLSIVQGAQNAFNATTNWLSNKMVPYMANGGVVTSPTLAMIGEAGPEAVIPLSKMGGMGGGVTVNVYGDVSGKELIAKVSEGIMTQLRMDTKLAF